LYKSSYTLQYLNFIKKLNLCKLFDDDLLSSSSDIIPVRNYVLIVFIEDFYNSPYLSFFINGVGDNDKPVYQNLYPLNLKSNNTPVLNFFSMFFNIDFEITPKLLESTTPLDLSTTTHTYVAETEPYWFLSFYNSKYLILLYSLYFSEFGSEKNLNRLS
jgi:hypothetical protein